VDDRFPRSDIIGTNTRSVVCELIIPGREYEPKAAAAWNRLLCCETMMQVDECWWHQQSTPTLHATKRGRVTLPRAEVAAVRTSQK
jgi:hypothetical protein